MPTFEESDAILNNAVDHSDLEDTPYPRQILPIIHYQRLSKDAQKAAEKLTNYLEHNQTRLSWDSRGNVYYRNKPIEGMNILPILQDISTVKNPKKTQFQTKKFLSLIKTLNVPEKLIQNKVYKKKYMNLPTAPLLLPKLRRNNTDPWKHFMN